MKTWSMKYFICNADRPKKSSTVGVDLISNCVPGTPKACFEQRRWLKTCFGAAPTHSSEGPAAIRCSPTVKQHRLCF